MTKDEAEARIAELREEEPLGEGWRLEIQPCFDSETDFFVQFVGIGEPRDHSKGFPMNVFLYPVTTNAAVLERLAGIAPR